MRKPCWRCRCRGELPVRVAAVISNRPERGPESRRRAGRADRRRRPQGACRAQTFDARALAECIGYAPDLVVLAGFMRILTEGFVAIYEGACSISTRRCCRPSRGLHTHQRALEEGVRIPRLHGAFRHAGTGSRPGRAGGGAGARRR